MFHWCIFNSQQKGGGCSWLHIQVWIRAEEDINTIRCHERTGPSTEKPPWGLSLVVEACVVLSASPPALAFWGPLCMKCWKWLIFVLPPLWERKTQLIHGDLSLIPRGLSQSHSFLLSSLGFSLLRESLPGTTVTPDLKIPKDPGCLMLMSSLELSHSKMFPHKGRVALLLPCAVRTLTEKVNRGTLSSTCTCLCWGFLNRISECHVLGEQPWALRSQHVTLWAIWTGEGSIFLTYWKYKDILKELGPGVQLQGFAVFAGATGVGVLRNWVSRGFYWALDPADRYIAAFVTAWLWWKWQVPYW